MNQHLEMVRKLKQQLNELGYQPWQLEMIIRDAIGSNILNENNQKQLEQVAETLQSYLGFAAKINHDN